MKMENGAYVSSPQLPPQAHLSAAAAFQAAAANSAAGGSVTPFQEALMSRMGRPFGLTVRLKCFYDHSNHCFIISMLIQYQLSEICNFMSRALR